MVHPRVWAKEHTPWRAAQYLDQKGYPCHICFVGGAYEAFKKCSPLDPRPEHALTCGSAVLLRVFRQSSCMLVYRVL